MDRDSAAPPSMGMQETTRRWGPALAAAIGLAALAFAAHRTGGEAWGWKLAACALIGAAAGIGLYHAGFGFTGAWRRLQRERRGVGVRAQLLLLAIIVTAVYPLIGEGVVGRGWVLDMSVASAIGAAMFGFGMQLGGGCGSGTLFTAGGGSTRMVLTLLAFIAGSVIWTGTNADFQAGVAAAWRAVGGEGHGWIAPYSLIAGFGYPGALGVTYAALGALALATIWIERRAHGGLERPRATGSLLKGPWSLVLGAFVLAGVVIACFFVLGRPWGVTAAYPIWGGKLADAVGLPVREWAYYKSGLLDRSIFSDPTGVMNFGVILGAMGAAGAAGAFSPKARLGLRDVATAILGGLLMGYGARLAWGCNVGAFIGGVSSASLHGWWWLLFGAMGSVVGVWTRSWIGMDKPAARSGSNA